ncbi:MAG: ABC transporter permease [Deltaproteobacteria bacterium]
MNVARELWQRREMLFSLVVRDLRTRHAGSVGGLAWAVLTPLFQLVILTTIFSLVLQVRLGGSAAEVPFAVTLAWGFFPWLAFQEGIGRATTALVDNGVFLRRMGFPPALVLAQPILASAVELVVALVLLSAAMPLLGVGISASLPLVVLPLVLGTLLALGVAFLVGTLHVYFRDAHEIVGAALQAWFYLTPIVYTLEIAPPALRGVLALNPLCGVVGGYRAFALGQPIPLLALAWSGFSAAALLWLGAKALTRARPELVDLV